LTGEKENKMQKDLIEYIAKSLVDDPSAVTVSESENEKGTVIELNRKAGKNRKVDQNLAERKCRKVGKALFA